MNNIAIIATFIALIIITILVVVGYKKWYRPQEGKDEKDKYIDYYYKQLIS